MIAEFPMDSVSGANPRPLNFLALPPAFKGAKIQYDDGGVDAELQYGGTGTRVWRFDYDGLTAVQTALLDSHFNASKWLEDEGMSAETFNFRDRDSGVLYSGVRYTKYEVSHIHVDIQTRVVEVTKFP